MVGLTNSTKIEYIFLKRSLVVFNQDLSKLSELITSLNSEECYSIETGIESIKTNLLEVEKKIQNKVLQNN